ncbi:MAG: class I SAM-dependent methyltransferase [Acidimicrobiales bacterium]
MGYYSDHVVPRLLNRVGAASRLAPWRQMACEGLSGTVVEIGFGSGLNVPFYPTKIERVFAVEPSSLAMKLGAKRIRSAMVPIERVGGDAHAIPLDDETCDMALSSFTLCSVDVPAFVLRQVWRVLKPGGQYHFLEHGLAPTFGLALTQRVLDPLQRKLAGGCHLTLRPLALIREAGFELLWSDEGPISGPKPWSYLSAGVAIKM